MDWRTDVGEMLELLHWGRNPTAEGGEKLEHPLATLNLTTDIQPCKWITHSVQLILILHKVGDWSFHSTKWEAAWMRLQQTMETGEWEIVFIRREQGKQENKIQVPGEWGCLEQATFILTPFCYINIRVYLGFSLLLTRRDRHSTSVVALGDKLPAKTHSATRWRARSNDDFPPARCQTGPALPWCSYHAMSAGQLPVLGCPTALMTRFIFQMDLQLISYLQVTTLFTVLYHRENYIHWSIFIMHKIGQYINIHTDTWVGTCISKQIFS